MKPSVCSVILLWVLAPAAHSLAGETLPPSADAVQAIFNKLVRASSQTNWPAECDARTELVALGPVVVPKLTEAARGHSDWRVRRSCYQVLTTSFADDERTLDALFQNGLLDQEPGIRYHCAFVLGDFKVQRAEQALRAAYKAATGKDDELIRITLAKSLAQLGKDDGLPVLITAVLDDAYMSRYIGNIGLKALSGKSLEDFDRYVYGEGASVIGGQELYTPQDALTSAERKAGRFQAATAYLKWLKTERPDLYRSINVRSEPRKAAAPR